MKKFFAVAAFVALGGVSAQAADLSPKVYGKAPPMLVQVYDWTGFYVGVNAGIGLGRDLTTVNFIPGPPSELTRLSPVGALGGAQVGYNWQAGNFVFGIETDIQGTSFRDEWGCSLAVIACTTNGARFIQKLDWFGTARGRLGLATGPVLSYLTGGFAYGRVGTSFNNRALGATIFDQTRSGWTIGSGVEAALGGNWTGKIEYLYIDFGSQTGTGELLNVPTSSFSSNIREHIFRVGLNYRVGGRGGYVQEPVANWTGFYLGGNAGAAIARNASSIGLVGFAPAQFSIDPKGYIGGAQIGYNWQAANWVFGVEADIQGSSQRDDKPCLFNCNFQSINFDQKMSWFGTARGRFGYSVGPSLFYATGGLAYGNVKTGIVAVTPLQATAFTTASTRSGYVVGGGIESAFNPFGWFGKNWTSKSEYLFVDLGRESDVLGVNGFNFSTRLQEHVFRTGLNYHFNSPVIARY